MPNLKFDRLSAVFRYRWNLSNLSFFSDAALIWARVSSRIARKLDRARRPVAVTIGVLTRGRQSPVGD
jgi:hypothetical protein